MIRFTTYLLLPLLLLPQAVLANSQTPLNVVVTIKPLHSLVASMMQGVTEPELLLTTTQSAHHTNLRPSDYRKLANADIVFWAGATLENFIPTLENKYRKRTQFISLMKADGIVLLPIRGRHKDNHFESHTNDPHFWLSTNNARKIISEITRTLITADASNKALYLKNKTQIFNRIHVLEKQLRKKLENIKTPFITYHDAYQYFEKEFQLNRISSVSLNEETAPSIKQIRSIKQLISEQQISCIFFEAPTKPPIINTLISHTRAQAFELDAIGLNLKAGPDLWFELLNNLGSEIKKCLRP
jgi:zinc transport system substrate-binding protein